MSRLRSTRTGLVWDVSFRSPPRRDRRPRPSQRHRAPRCRTADGPRAGRHPLGAAAAPHGRARSRQLRPAARPPPGHEPVAYILGTQPFFGLDLPRHPRCADPARRQRSAGRGRAQGPARCARACSIAAPARARCCWRCWRSSPQRRASASTASFAALEVAAANAARLGLATRARMLHADWDEPRLGERPWRPFDLILANPPYVEDRAAARRLGARTTNRRGRCSPGADGLDAYRILIPQLPALLAPHGVALGRDRCRIGCPRQRHRRSRRPHRQPPPRPRRPPPRARTCAQLLGPLRFRLAFAATMRNRGASQPMDARFPSGRPNSSICNRAWRKGHPHRADVGTTAPPGGPWRSITRHVSRPSGRRRSGV